MLRLTLAVALVSGCFALGAPSAAIADDGLAGLCHLAGGAMRDGVCVLPDGRTVTCAEDESECVVHDAPVLVRPFGKLINVPKLLFKKPAGPGPVEIEPGKGKTVLVAPTRRLTDAVQTPTFNGLDTSSTKLKVPVEKTVTLHDAPVTNIKTITVAPTVRFKPH